MTPRELILQTAARFRSAGIPDPENDSALLLASLCGGIPLSLRLDTETVLEQSQLSRYEQLVQQRLNRYPLQYILSEAPFCGHMFFVDQRVLIPRPETELLCSRALEILNDYCCPRILDLCCGSGCIGLTLKAVRPDSVVTLSDLSADALAVAAVNMNRLGVSVFLHQGDLLDGFLPASFDMIICNPPYIPAADCETLQPEVLFEPRLALDGGPDGLGFYRRLAASALSVLMPGGALLLELGIGEAAPVSDLLSSAGCANVQIHKDYAGIDRMAVAFRPDGGKYAG